MTIKQKAVAKDLLENVGKPIGKAMLDAGYSPATADNPDHLTSSKGWAELMEHYLPDAKLLDVHEQGLEAMKPIGALVLIKNGKDGKPEQILKDDQGMIEVPDHATRAKYLDLAYKVKRRMGPENQTNVQINNNDGNTITFVNFKDESKS